MFNDGSIDATLGQILGWGIVLVAIFIVLGARKKKFSDAGSMAGVAVLAVIVASLGILVTNGFGERVINSIFG